MRAPCIFSAIGSHSFNNNDGGAVMAARQRPVPAAAAATILASPSPSPPSSSLSPSGAHLGTAAIAPLPQQSWAADLAGFSGGAGVGVGVGEAYYVAEVAEAAADLSSLPGMGMGMGMAPVPGWLALDAALASSSESPAAAGASSAASSLRDLVSSHQAATAEALETEAEAEPAPACGRTLAELQVDIDATLGILPTPPLLHLPADDDATVAARLAEMVPRLSTRSFMEHIFVVIQRLTDLYPEAVDEALGTASGRPPRQEEEPCQIPNCVHRHELPLEFAAGLDETALQYSDVVVDLALAGQLVSCHLRLLDVLDRLVLYALSCFRLKAAASQVRHPDFLLPELKVGSFTPVGSSAQLMQVVLIKDMIDKLSQHLKHFSDAVDAEVPETPSLGTRSLKLQTELLDERQARVSKHFKSISSFLVNRDLTER